MPTPEARAAFADAHHLLEKLRAVHTREIELLSESNQAVDALHCKIDDVRTEWTDTFREYADAMARYVLAVEKSRQELSTAARLVATPSST